MPDLASRSWADVAGGRQATPNATQSFVWRAGKKGLAKVSTRPGCNGKHCDNEEGSCKQTECKAMLLRQLGDSVSGNALTASSISLVTGEIEGLRAAILEHCNINDFTLEMMQVTRKAVVRANQKKLEPDFCECTSCQLQYHQKEKQLELTS